MPLQQLHLLFRLLLGRVAQAWSRKPASTMKQAEICFEGGTNMRSPPARQVLCRVPKKCDENTFRERRAGTFQEGGDGGGVPRERVPARLVVRVARRSQQLRNLLPRIQQPLHQAHIVSRPFVASSVCLKRQNVTCLLPIHSTAERVALKEGCFTQRLLHCMGLR